MKHYWMLGIGAQEIGEEQQLDDDEKDKQLDDDDDPQRLSHSHAAETVIVQVEHLPPEPFCLFLVVTHGHEG